MTILFDPHSSWAPLRERAENTNNPKHKNLLNEVANHMEAEIQGRHEALMATLIEEPIYHFWRVGEHNMVLQGRSAVSEFYANMFANNGQQFFVVIERIIVDDGGVITEGKVRQIYQRDALLEMGVSTVGGQSIADHELWLSNTQLMTVWPAGEKGKLIGEDIYFGEEAMQTLSPYQRSDLPDYFVL